MSERFGKKPDRTLWRETSGRGQSDTPSPSPELTRKHGNSPENTPFVRTRSYKSILSC